MDSDILEECYCSVTQEETIKRIILGILQDHIGVILERQDCWELYR